MQMMEMEEVGHVRVYILNGSSWVQIGQDIDGEASLDQSGYSISINSDGNRIIIGSIKRCKWCRDAGHARIFEWNGNSWDQLGQDIDGEFAGDQFGYSVSINSGGDVVAIGGYANDSNGNGAGHYRVYPFDGNNWVKRGIFMMLEISLALCRFK